MKAKSITEPTTVYMIVNSQGLYSTGGSYPRFLAKGKTWKNRAAIGSHLAQSNEYPAGCTIISIRMTPEIVATESVSSRMAAIHEAKNKRREAEAVKRMKREAVRVKSEYEKILEKLSPSDRAVIEAKK